MISGFCHKVTENCALLDYYEASSGNFLPLLRDKLSDPSSRFKNPKDSCLQPQYGASIEKSVGSENVSVVWCKPIGLLQVVDGGECSSVAGQKRSMMEGILTSVIVRHRRTLI